MRALKIGAVLVLAGGASTGAGTSVEGVRCYYDWANAPPQNVIVRNSQEYSNILAACARGQAESVPWDDYIRTFEQALDMGVLTGGARTNLVSMIDMMRKERDNLRTGTPLTGRPTDTNVRTLTLDSAFDRAASSTSRFSVEPRFRAWVPAWMRDKVRETLTTPMRITGVLGKVTIRRGDKVILLDDALLGRGDLLLRPGDIFETGPDGYLELSDRGGQLTINANSTLGIGLRGSCLQVIDAGNHRSYGWFLIEGAIQWATTTNAVKGQCVLAGPVRSVSVRGTEFSARQAVTDTGAVLTVHVESGAVDVSNDAGAVQTIAAGDTKTFRDSIAARTSVEWTVVNACEKRLQIRMHEVDGNVRAASWSTHTVEPGGSARFVVDDVTIGTRLCYGARSSDGTSSWGLGLDGRNACERCCRQITATSGPQSVRLTCGQ